MIDDENKERKHKSCESNFRQTKGLAVRSPLIYNLILRKSSPMRNNRQENLLKFLEMLYNEYISLLIFCGL